MKLMVSAGEVSGDLHAANVINRLRARYPEVQVFGMGGPRMAAEGCRLIEDVTQHSVMGISEVLGQIRRFLQILRRMKSAMRSERPDVLMLVDFADFNVHLARAARHLCIPTVYYIPPKAWAWRSGRARKLGEMVDVVASIFPFEAEFYRRAGARVEFVGHPIVDIARSKLSTSEARSQFGVRSADAVVGIMPGSRRSEVSRLYPVMAKAAREILEYIPNTRFLLALAPSIPREMLMPEIPNLQIREGQTYDMIRACDLVILASGTASLEAACLGTPMIIVYKVSVITWAVARALVHLDSSGLPNIIAGERIVPEYLQSEAQSSNVAQKAVGMLMNRSALTRQRERLARIKSALAAMDAPSRVSEIIARLAQQR